MSTDTSFFTNEQGFSLKERFGRLIKDSELFDCLVGYFYLSGFNSVYPSLENTNSVRILIGISTDKDTLDTINQGKNLVQADLKFSYSETKEIVEGLIQHEMEESEDTHSVEDGVCKFIEWIRNGKLQIKAYPSQNIHAKLYIMTFKEDAIDKGRVITGSSNFTKSGLEGNLEFNVELKNPGDYEFAKDKFDELWREAVDVSEKYVDTIENKTWLSSGVTPYHLYLKFLYEYFKAELNETGEVFLGHVPKGFLRLAYQEQAVLNAKRIVESYGGVFISDVVGLGKTYIASMLAGQLEGRTLVIAPPVLLDSENSGSWRNSFIDFNIAAEFESLGKLDNLLNGVSDKFSNIIIDEAHGFRNEATTTYEKLSEICRGKKVVLVTATPYNNTPKDILSLLKLFQKPRKSDIPNLPDLESFFSGLDKNLRHLNRKDDYEKYMEVTKSNAKEIREKVLKHLMVRRTRTEIKKYFEKDLKEQGLKFPNVEKPRALYYQLNKKEDQIFSETIELIAGHFTYARYMPMTYYTGKFDMSELQGQLNMGRFMKILLVKRLESSFYAFKQSVDRFLKTYEIFIEEFKKGNVYTSKKHTGKVFTFLANDDDESIQNLIDNDKAERYSSKKFKTEFLEDLEHDKKLLIQIQNLWKEIDRDPKLLAFIERLSDDEILKKGHIIIFTESKETARYLFENIDKEFPGEVLKFDGSSHIADRDRVIRNFDAKSQNKESKYRILITTEVLSEGVNLHRSNVVINYDIPWNPTRLMQRVGRINRVDTTFDTIYTYNFFPSLQGNSQIALQQAAETKIASFLSLLGDDAELLTEGEPVDSHALFERLTSEEVIDGENEENSELKYLKVIEGVRENDLNLFEKIKRLPRKSRSAKSNLECKGSLVTYFRKSGLQKFFLSSGKEISSEIDFVEAAKIFECDSDTKRGVVSEDMFDLLEANKKAFDNALAEDGPEMKNRGGRNSGMQILKILKATQKNLQQLTDEQELYLDKVVVQIDEGGIPKKTLKNVLKALTDLRDQLIDPRKVITVLQNNISNKLLEAHYAETIMQKSSKREVVLSLYLTKN